MGWSLYENNKFLPPLQFSNGKTQEDIVKEVLEAIKEGYKIIFIRGICGTGKSAIALNVIKELGRGSVVVPVKTLQTQYIDDYTEGKHLLAQDRKKLKIKTIMGRKNFKCPYENCLASNHELPCKIEIKKENIKLLKAYLKENPLFKYEDFGFGLDLRLEEIGRFNIAPACPYWSPIISQNISHKLEKAGDKTKVVSYNAVSGQKHLHLRKPGCQFYEQYKAYANADVIIFNSKMYEIETLLGRKPATDVEVIDECDKFLDNLGNEKYINLNKFSLKISHISATIGNFSDKTSLMDFNDLVLEAKKEGEQKENKIFLLKKSKMLQVIRELLSNPILKTLEDLKDYFETALTFNPLLEETYIRYNRNERKEIIATLVTINLEKRLKEFLQKNKVFIMMSGTIHSEDVLREIFGLRNFKIIEAEIKPPGKVSERTTKLEQNFRYREFKAGKVTRKQYLKALDSCIKQTKPPTLVQVNSFSDLPDKQEKIKHDLKIKTREELQAEQNKYKKGTLLKKFKKGEIKVLYGTVYNRGVDLPGETCNSIILTKYPYPEISSLFWRVFEAQDKQKFRKFYFDTAKREFLQRIYRGLRSQDDRILLLSPDIRCFEEMRKHF